MNSNYSRIRQMTLAAFFIAIQAVMTLTQIGYIPVGAINVTTMHIPVILAGIFLGSRYGALVGFVFGLTSMLRATFAPGLTSFLFSPFITVGGISGNYASLLIAFGPRILLGWLSAKMFRFLRDETDFDQLLFEHRMRNGCRWLHVSYRSPTENRHQAIGNYEC